MTDAKVEMHDVNWQKVWPDRIPVILRDLAPTNPFNPRNLWPEEKDKADGDDDKAPPAQEEDERTEKADKKNPKAKIKKADLIRMQLAKDKREKQSRVDEEKLANVKKAANIMSMKMVTPTGRLKQLYEVLKEACKKKQMADAVDTLWEIQRTKLGPSASSSSSRKKHDKQKQAEREEELKLLAELTAVHKKYRKYTKQITDWLADRDLIEYQLTGMSDRLPPLNMHHMNRLVLDDWQCSVLQHIDDRHSVLVCTPTSSGKTVLSSYVTVASGTTGSVLFVVPTDPLAWQVAALFQSMVKGTVALITEGTTFLPQGFRVAVGTPRAVESTLLEIGYDFSYAVYDEVHDLNGAEGDALERILKAVTCPFLALSATVGNAARLRDWWQMHHPRPVHLLEYKGRFINLQRLVWKDGDKADSKEDTIIGELTPLHPCAGITVEYLVKEGFESGDLAFTPRDTFALWKALENTFPRAKIEQIAPQKFFEQFKEDGDDENVKIVLASSSSSKRPSSAGKKDADKDKKKKKSKKKGDEDDAGDDKTVEVDLGVRCHRITLMESKAYEEVVKKRMQELAHEEPKLTEQVLQSFVTDIGLDNAISTSSKLSIDVYSLMKELVTREMLPVISFQLDSVRCRELFNQLLQSLEDAEMQKYPNFRDKARLEYAAWEKQQAQKKKQEGASKSKDREENEREAQAFEEKPPPDIYAPHPEFVLAPVGFRLSAIEYKEIKWQLKRELPEDADDSHPLVRALRRGIGIYNQNLPAAYLRVVQALAQAGRLAVVFSDDSLAYGVNMPFRTCCFCEDTSGGVLTSLMVQQMAGRAGRRGLDRQGNLVFAGLSWPRIQLLMRGLLPDVTGRVSLYPTIALQGTLSPHLDGTTMQRIVKHPLEEFMRNGGASPKAAGAKKETYLAKSVNWMADMGLLTHGYKLKVDRSVAMLVWECRDDCSEALGIYWILEQLFFEFQHKAGENIGVQLAMFNILLRIVGREKYQKEDAHAGELSVLPGQEEAWDKVTKLLEEYNARLDAMNAPPELRLRVALDDPLDGYVWRIVVDNQIPTGLETFQLYLIKKRLHHVGDRLRLMHNLLMRSGRYGVLEEIVRKCFRRIKWILIDSEK